jgi:hypothetical protein
LSLKGRDGRFDSLRSLTYNLWNATGLSGETTEKGGTEMATASPEVLIGFMVVLGLVAVGLTIWLLRYVVRGQGQKKKRPVETPPEPLSKEHADDVPVALHSTGEPPASTEQLGLPAANQVSTTEFAEPEHSTPSPPAPVQQPREPVSEPGDVLLMQVWQDRAGYLVVEIEGQRYRRLFDVRNGVIGRRVLEIISRLVAFSKGQESRVAASPALQPARDVAQATAPSTAIAAPLADVVVEEQAQAFVEKLQQEPEVKPRALHISTDPVPFRRRGPAQEAHITLNLAGEIDQMLQIRVKASPEFSQRYIRVANAPDGGLRFDVDGARYSGLDEIPDSQVQALIRAAISDWEARR